ncbi:glutamine synthetase, partial [Clostridium perfringens]|nr:glutamine synthetase [Clostridium perfringens]
ATVYENLLQLDNYTEKLNVLKRNHVFSDKLINSFKLAIIQRWTTDIVHRIILSHSSEIRTFKKLHSNNALDLDVSNWMAINDLRHYIMKDTYTNKSLFTRIRESLANKNYSLASDLSLELDDKMST